MARYRLLPLAAAIFFALGAAQPNETGPDPRLVQLLRAGPIGIERFNMWRALNPIEEVNLRGADLRDVVLHGADLTLADLTNAQLQGAVFGISWADENEKARDCRRPRQSQQNGDARNEFERSREDLDEIRRMLLDCPQPLEIRMRINGAAVQLHGANLNGANLDGAVLTGAEGCDQALNGPPDLEQRCANPLTRNESNGGDADRDAPADGRGREVASAPRETERARRVRELVEAGELPAFTDAEIGVAIDDLSQDSRTVASMSDRCTAGLGWRDVLRAAGGIEEAEIDVTFTTTRGLIALRARESAISVEAVAPEERAHAAWFFVRPRVRGASASDFVSNIAIRPRREDGPMFQPLVLSFDGPTASAMFRMPDVDGIVRQLDRDLDVVITTPSRERRCHLNRGRVRRALDLGAPSGEM